MQPLSFAHDEAASRLVEQVEAFVAAAGSLSDLDRLAASRVAGWSRLQGSATGLRRAVGALGPGTVEFQDRRMTTGDFLATWVVELAIHQLDLDLADDVSGLDWSRATLEAIAGAPLPEALDDGEAVLVGLGRTDRPTSVELDAVYPVSL